MGGGAASVDWKASAPHWLPSLSAKATLALDLSTPAFVIAGADRAWICNETAAALFGVPPDLQVGHPASEALGPLWPALAPAIAAALGGQSSSLDKLDISRPQAPERWCNISLAPVRGDTGAVIGVFATATDITRQILRERLFGESESRYRTLFDSMDEGFCIIEFFDGPHGPLSDYIHIEANAAYAHHAGIENVVGQKLREMVGDEADAWVERYGAVLRTGEPIRFQQELIKTSRVLELSAFRVEPASLKQVAVLFQDITARQRTEEALKRLNATLQARVAEYLAERKVLADIVEGTNAFVQVADHNYRWLAINGAAAGEFERIYGVRPAVGMSMLEALAGLPEQQEAVRAIWGRALAGEEFVEIAEFGNPERDRRSYEMRFNTLRDAQGRPIGAYQFVYDVTQRLEDQERLRRTEEALRQAQKMEAVGQLTGGLAHDFNNLLAGISGAFEMIGTRIAQGRTGEIERFLGAGQGATRRAASLTHRLLAFSRRQTLQPKPTIINRLMADFAELVRRTVGPSIEVETIGAAGLWLTMVDANQLENALLNLCINARDAMPDGGKITIETANRWLDAAAAKEHGLDPGQYVSICVSDTGTGIDKDILPLVFDPFFTTKPIGQGTGLGLSMVYGFARQSNGHVRIYSELGEGTMVCVYLPRHIGDEEAEEPATSDPTAETADGETILIIDDEPSVRMLVADALADHGYACIEAADGPAGLKILESDRPIELLITDVGLPGGLNGRQVADAARQMRRDLKVLFITGYAENAAFNHGHIGHGMEVLTKPFAVENLIARVNRTLRNNR